MESLTISPSLWAPQPMPDADPPVSQLCRSYVICLYVAEFCRPGWDLDKYWFFTRGTLLWFAQFGAANSSGATIAPANQTAKPLGVNLDFLSVGP